jgi:light-regulated signal transduction histidine kinase (bacteriophytochrome)
MKGAEFDRYTSERGRAEEGGTAGDDRSVEGLRKDGGIVPLDLTVAEWRNGNGEVCYTWVMHDITERQRLNAELRAVSDTANAAADIEHQLLRQLRHSNRELKIANEGLQKFTSIVAHDLRGPLRRIEAFIGVLQEEPVPGMEDERADILNRVANGAARMKLMLDSLLQYSRYSSAAIIGKTARLEDVVQDALAASDAGALGIEVRISMQGVSDVKGDAILLSHVLQNLISNAVKFRAARSPTITIEAHELDQEIRLSVADNGIGIDPKFADKIFEMFYRLHDDEEYEGTGIGLAVCRKIINDHAGRIWLDTNHVCGTKFVCVLRAAGSNDLPAAVPAPRIRRDTDRIVDSEIAIAPSADA